MAEQAAANKLCFLIPKSNKNNIVLINGAAKAR